LEEGYGAKEYPYGKKSRIQRGGAEKNEQGSAKMGRNSVRGMPGARHSSLHHPGQAGREKSLANGSARKSLKALATLKKRD